MIEAGDRRREKQAPCREPNAELDPRTPGSCPGPKAGAKLLSHPGIPEKRKFDCHLCHVDYAMHNRRCYLSSTTDWWPHVFQYINALLSH